MRSLFPPIQKAHLGMHCLKSPEHPCSFGTSDHTLILSGSQGMASPLFLQGVIVPPPAEIKLLLLSCINSLLKICGKIHVRFFKKRNANETRSNTRRATSTVC